MGLKVILIGIALKSATDVGYLYMPILVFLGLSVLELFPMYATDRRQTDRQTRLGGGGIII